MEDYKEECVNKSATINELNNQLYDLTQCLRLKNKELKTCKKQRNAALDALSPTKESLNRMTAEHGKLLRKLKRKENKS